MISENGIILGGNLVSRETEDLLRDFEGLFKHWNKAINLAAPSTLDNFWERHIVDSIQLLQYRKNAETWVDMGSGGGLPGIIIGIASRNTSLRMTLIESNHKKAAFLRTCVSRYDLAMEIHTERVEQHMNTATDIVSARALANLDTLLGLSCRWIGVGGGRALFHKGRDYVSEVERARVNWHFDLVEHQSVVDPMSRILEISNVKRSEQV